MATMVDGVVLGPVQQDNTPSAMFTVGRSMLTKARAKGRRHIGHLPMLNFAMASPTVRVGRARRR